MATIIGDKIKLTNYTYYLEDNIKKEKGDGTREEHEKVLDAFDIDWHSFNVIDNIRNKTYPIGSTEDLLSYVSMAYSNTNINLLGIEQNNIKPSKSLSNIYFDKQTNIFSYTYFNNVGYFSSFSNKGEIFNDYINNQALGVNSHAEGTNNIINENGHSGHAEGNGNTVNGQYSHAEGQSNTINSDGVSCHVEGNSNTVGGKSSHAEGEFNEALGDYSHVGGFESTANISYAFAHGYNAHVGEAVGIALGEFINTYSRAEIALGRYNQSDESSAYILTVGIGTGTNDRKNALSINKSGNSFFDNEIHCKTLIVDDITVDNMNVGNITSGSITADSIIKITYEDLLILRNSNKLIPGTWYRIINYETIISGSGVGSMEKPFDILVFATSENSLLEEAKAIHRENSNYFENSNLNAWRIWYCLDNDSSRFGWANSGGKGVIYRMIDEFNNDCPYDFKNIYYGSEPYYEYTFHIRNTPGTEFDEVTTLNYPNLKCINNIIKPYFVGNIQQLNNIIFSFDYSVSGGTQINCHCNEFDNNCYDVNIRMNSDYCFNKIGKHCNNIIFNNGIHNYIDDNSSNITLFDSCNHNILGKSCSTINIDANSTNNIFGNFCNNINLNGSNNKFDDYCSNIRLHENSIGNEFSFNSANITLGPNNSKNTFGNFCGNITLGEYNEFNTFGNNCSNIKFISSTTSYLPYLSNNLIESGVKNITIKNTQNLSQSSQLKNIRLSHGLYNKEFVLNECGAEHEIIITSANTKEILV